MPPSVIAESPMMSSPWPPPPLWLSSTTESREKNDVEALLRGFLYSLSPTVSPKIADQRRKGSRRKKHGDRHSRVSCCRFFAPMVATNLGIMIVLCARSVGAFQPSLPLVSARPGFATTSIEAKYPAEAARETWLHAVGFRDADYSEMMVGGERYEMVPLPDSMLDRTIFVGNLDEWVRDGDLSDLFQSVSTLRSLPACVVRRPDMQSLEYGFVSFPTVDEKESAILRFHRSEWRGRILKVEAIRDNPKIGRVKVPGKIVEYCCGSVKKTRNGVNTMRSISRPTAQSAATHRRKKKKNKKNKKEQAVASTKMESFSSKIMSRLEECSVQQLHDEMKKNIKSAVQKNNKRHRFPPHRLDKSSLMAFQRASRKGFLTLGGTGFRRGRKTNHLANTHRQWCDERDKPQIILCKASGGRPLDNVIVDLSPLRMSVLADGDLDVLNNLLLEWKTQVASAAKSAGMILRKDYPEDNCESLTIVSLDDEPEQEVLQSFLIEAESKADFRPDVPRPLASIEAWSTKSIFLLPTLSMGVFEGERSQAKSMVQELALLWDIPSEPSAKDFGKKYVDHKGGKNKHRQNRNLGHNRTGRNIRGLDFYL